MTDPASTALAAPRLSLGDGAAAYDAAVERARDEDWATRLFARDVTLWTTDPRVGEAIAERLGWLDAPTHFADRTAGLEAFGDAVVEEGFTTAVVAGMGGSSLAPDVLHRTFGIDRGLPRAAHPRLDRPGLRGGDARRPRPASDARHRRDQVRHDDRAERLPGLRLGPRRAGARRPSLTTATSAPAPTSRPITDPDSVAPHRAHQTTSARSSSTRLTSAAGTRR